MPAEASAPAARTKAASPATQPHERRAHRTLLPSAHATGSARPSPLYTMKIA